MNDLISRQAAINAINQIYPIDTEYLTVDGRKHRKAVAWMPLPEPWRGAE